MAVYFSLYPSPISSSFEIAGPANCRNVAHTLWQVSISVQSAVFCALPEVHRIRFVEKVLYIGVIYTLVEHCRAWNLLAAVAGHGSTWSGEQGAGVLLLHC